MTEGTQIREIILEVLLQVTREGEHSHVAIRHALDKVQYLPRQERAFINRVCQGTIEHRIRIDYVIDRYSSVKTGKMKPVIREILRSAVYQLLFMDGVPDAAACNEAVKLAQKKGFYSLKGFVNGVLRTISREKDHIFWPDREKEPLKYLSVWYSLPMWLVSRWTEQFGYAATEQMAAYFLQEHPTCIRCQQYQMNQEMMVDSLRKQGITVNHAPYLPYAFYISGYDHLSAVKSFLMGRFQVQDVSSMLVAEAANPQMGNYVIDLCAAPGGKSLHVADKMEGTGQVEARDLTEYKVDLIRENIERMRAANVTAVVADAVVPDPASVEKADVVLADVPCSGLGVIGKKPDIKYRMNEEEIAELVTLQRRILHNAASYVKPGGTLIYSTCTVTPEENQENIRWFTENYSYRLDSLNPYLPDELHSDETAAGWLQLLPGVSKTDGFFLARLVRNE